MPLVGDNFFWGTFVEIGLNIQFSKISECYGFSTIRSTGFIVSATHSLHIALNYMEVHIKDQPDIAKYCDFRTMHCKLM